MARTQLSYNYLIDRNRGLTYNHRIFKTLDSLQRVGKFRDPEFLIKLFKQKKLKNCNYLDESYLGNFANNIRSVIEVLNNKFGNNWEFYLHPEMEEVRDSVTGRVAIDVNYNSFMKVKNYQLSCLVLYPEITIKNSNDESHLIRDLLVNFTISSIENDCIYISELTGARATRTLPEHVKKYSHSHLKSQEYSSWSNVLTFGSFCLGNGEINEIIEGSLGTPYSPEIFEMFLYSIDTLIEWESLEGVPYQYINNIGKRDSSGNITVDRLHSQSFINRASVYINQRLFSKNKMVNIYGHSSYEEFRNSLKVSIVDGRFIISRTKELEKALMKVFLYSESDDVVYNSVVKIVDGGYIAYRKDTERVSLPNLPQDSQFRFNNSTEIPKLHMQGRDITYKVIPLIEEQEIEEDNIDPLNEYIVHPDVYNRIINDLEQMFYENSIRKSIC